MKTSPRGPLILAFLIIFLLGVVAGFYFGLDHNSEKTGREEEYDSFWENRTDPQSGASFRYPEKITTNYIQPTDWPPQVQVLDEPFTCTEAGAAGDRAGRTEERVINGRTYCVTEVTEGAAGSVYTQYAYAFSQDDKVVILTFSLRFTQCGNYDQAARQACEAERNTFDIDDLVDRSAQTLTLSSGN